MKSLRRSSSCWLFYYVHLILASRAFTAYWKGGSCQVKNPWKLIYINTQENNNGTARIILQFQVRQIYRCVSWSSGRHVISRCGTACVLPITDKKERWDCALIRNNKAGHIVHTFAHLHNDPAHAGSQRVLPCSPLQCWIWSRRELRRPRDALSRAHSVQSPHIWFVTFLMGPERDKANVLYDIPTRRQKHAG